MFQNMPFSSIGANGFQISEGKDLETKILT